MYVLPPVPPVSGYMYVLPASLWLHVHLACQSLATCPSCPSVSGYMYILPASLRLHVHLARQSRGWSGYPVTTLWHLPRMLMTYGFARHWSPAFCIAHFCFARVCFAPFFLPNAYFRCFGAVYALTHYQVTLSCRKSQPPLSKLWEADLNSE